MTEPTPDAADYAKRLTDEYGTYRAKGLIYVDGVLAYNEGAAVPKSAVEGDSSTVSKEQVENVSAFTPDVAPNNNSTSSAAPIVAPVTSTSIPTTTTKG